MSYILDALKKSSEERQKLESANKPAHPFVSVQSPAPPEPKGKNPTMTIIILTVLIISVITGFYRYYIFVNSQHQSSTETTNPDMAQTPISQAPARFQVKEINRIEPDSSLQQNPPARKTAGKMSIENQSPPGARLSENSIPLLKDLPLNIQASLPEMKYSGHVYSDNPARRMIMINSAVVREGEMVSTGIKLLEITKNGLIMDYNGSTFRLQLF